MRVKMAKKIFVGSIVLLFAIFLVVTIVDFNDNNTKEITISFNTNGGAYLEDLVIDYKKGDEVDLPSPTRTGFQFLGWFTDKDLNHVITDEFYENQNIIQLYAKWDYLFDKLPINESYNSIDEGVLIEGIVYAMYLDQGFFIKDDSGFILVKENQSSISVGDKILVEGYVRYDDNLHYIESVYRKVEDSNFEDIEYAIKSFDDFVSDEFNLAYRYNYFHVQGFVYEMNDQWFLRNLNSQEDIRLINQDLSLYKNKYVDSKLVRLNQMGEMTLAYVSVIEESSIIDKLYSIKELTSLPNDLMVNVSVQGNVYYELDDQGQHYAYIIDDNHRIKIEDSDNLLEIGDRVQLKGTFNSYSQLLFNTNNLEVLSRVSIDEVPTYSVNSIESLLSQKATSQFMLLNLSGSIEKDDRYHFAWNLSLENWIDANGLDPFVDSQITIKVIIEYTSDGHIRFIDTNEILEVHDFQSTTYQNLFLLNHGEYAAFEGFVSYKKIYNDLTYIYLYDGLDYLMVRFNSNDIELEIGDYVQTYGKITQYGDEHPIYMYEAKVLDAYDNGLYVAEDTINLSDSQEWLINENPGRIYSLTGILFIKDGLYYLVDPNSKQLLKLIFIEDNSINLESGDRINAQVIKHGHTQSYVFVSMLEFNEDETQDDIKRVNDYYHALMAFVKPSLEYNPYDQVDYFMFLYQYFENVGISVQAEDSVYYNEDTSRFLLVDGVTNVVFDIDLTYLNAKSQITENLIVNPIEYLNFEDVYDYDVQNDLHYIKAIITDIFDDYMVVYDGEIYLLVKTNQSGFEKGNQVIVKLLNIEKSDVPVITAGYNQIHVINENKYFQHENTPLTVNELMNYDLKGNHYGLRTSMTGVIKINQNGVFLVSENQSIPLYIDESDIGFIDNYFAKHVTFDTYLLGIKDSRLYIKLNDTDKTNLIANKLSLDIESSYVIERYKEEVFYGGNSSQLFTILDEYYDQVSYSIVSGDEALFDLSQMIFHEVEENKTLTLILNISHAGTNVTKNVTFNLEPVPYTKTNDIQGIELGDYVYIEGVVRYQYYEIFMIQDEWGVIQVVAEDDGTLNIGDSVLIYGRVYESGNMKNVSVVGDAYIYHKTSPMNLELTVSEYSIEDLLSDDKLNHMYYMKLSGVLTIDSQACGRNLSIENNGQFLCLNNIQGFDSIYQYLGHEISMNAYVYDYSLGNDQTILPYVRIDQSSLDSITSYDIDLNIRLESLLNHNALEFYAPLRHVKLFEELNTYFDQVIIELPQGKEALYDDVNNRFNEVNENTSIRITLKLNYQGQDLLKYLDIEIRDYSHVDISKLNNQTNYSIFYLQGKVTQLTDKGFILLDGSGSVEILFDGQVQVGDNVIVYVQKIPEDESYVIKSRDYKLRVTE